MYSSFAWGFWWLNVVICGYCILYLTRKRFQDGTPSLLTATGLMWVLQLLWAFLLLAMKASPWHLLWLAPVSVLMAMFVDHFAYKRRTNEHFKMPAPAPVSSRPSTTPGDEKNRIPADQISELETMRQESRKRGKTEIARQASALLDSDEKRDTLYESLGKHSALADKFHQSWPYLVRSNTQPTPLQVSQMFNNLAIKLVAEGDPFVGLKSMECSLLFDKGGPEHWVAAAEVFYALHDRAAARYAATAIEHQDACDAANQAGAQSAHSAGHKVLHKRMQEIIHICAEHKKWVDSDASVEK
jgi:hypothetical protein